MVVDRLVSFLRRHGKIAIDTSPFIYQLEASPRYPPVVDPIFAWLERPGRAAVTSTITLTELLVHPYREADQERADRLYAVLSRYPNLAWIAPSLEVADLAAQMRAQHRLRTPDALQAATAVIMGATGLVTNDAILRRVPGFETLVLDDLL